MVPLRQKRFYVILKHLYFKQHMPSIKHCPVSKWLPVAALHGYRQDVLDTNASHLSWPILFLPERVSVCVCPLCVFLLALSCQTVPASLCLPLSYLTLPSLSTLGDGNQSDRTHATICPSSMATSCPPRHRERLFVFAACEFV